MNKVALQLSELTCSPVSSPAGSTGLQGGAQHPALGGGQGPVPTHLVVVEVAAVDVVAVVAAEVDVMVAVAMVDTLTSVTSLKTSFKPLATSPLAPVNPSSC